MTYEDMVDFVTNELDDSASFGVAIAMARQKYRNIIEPDFNMNDVIEQVQDVYYGARRMEVDDECDAIFDGDEADEVIYDDTEKFTEVDGFDFFEEMS